MRSWCCIHYYTILYYTRVVFAKTTVLCLQTVRYFTDYRADSRIFSFTLSFPPLLPQPPWICNKDSQVKHVWLNPVRLCSENEGLYTQLHRVGIESVTGFRARVKLSIERNTKPSRGRSPRCWNAQLTNELKTCVIFNRCHIRGKRCKGRRDFPTCHLRPKSQRRHSTEWKNHPLCKTYRG